MEKAQRKQPGTHHLPEKTKKMMEEEMEYLNKKNNTDIRINHSAFNIFHHISMEYMTLIREDVVLMGLHAKRAHPNTLDVEMVNRFR